jgi:hypothetical protein
MKMTAGIVAAAVILALGLGAAALQFKGPSTESEVIKYGGEGAAAQLAADTSSEVEEAKRCPNGSPFYGCCSSHGGIKTVTPGNTVICNDGKSNLSCTTHLRGCCSAHGAIESVSDDGNVQCSDKSTSPTCQCEPAKPKTNFETGN